MDIRKVFRLALMSGVLAFASCDSGYRIVGIESSREPISSVYDSNVCSQAVSLVEKYKHSIDSIMSPVVGKSATDLSSFRPESPLSNLMADVLRNSASVALGKPADLAVMNMGGIRSSISEGDITYGNIFEVAPFENALCILVMDGKTLLELFGQIASVNGEGLSGANLVISKDGKLLSAKVNGKAVVDDMEYTVATIDYLAEGNDKMLAFRKAKSKIVPKDAVLRDLLLKYVSDCHKKGKMLDARIEGRIVVR